MLNVLLAPLQWLFLLLSNIVLIPVGLVVVALAIPYRVPGVSLSDGRAIVNLPRWAHLFGNDFDGLLGDKRLWWAQNCDGLVLWGLLPLLRRLGLPLATVTAESVLAMYWWAALRNPVNNKRLLALYSCPVSRCEIRYRGQAVVEDKPGQGGWQFVIARQGLRRWFGFYFVHEWSATRAFVVRLGFKIKPDHAGSDEPAKGATTKINPFKSI